MYTDICLVSRQLYSFLGVVQFNLKKMFFKEKLKVTQCGKDGGSYFDFMTKMMTWCATLESMYARAMLPNWYHTET